MTSPLVPTVLHFTSFTSSDHDTVTTAPPWTESCTSCHGLQNSSSSSSHLCGLGTQGAASEVGELSTRGALLVEEPTDNCELKLPKMRSLIIMICTNVLIQITFFIIISSGSKYAEYLGGSATFSGLVIGIPNVVSAMTLVPLVKLDGGAYKFALHLCCVAALVGSILYALAYQAHFLYLILLGRIVMGVSFTQLMYIKRYCSDPRIVGVRRRTTLAGWLVVGQNTGFTVGPFFGGLLYKVGFRSAVFNGYTSPGWIMAAVWLAFWAVVAVLFDDVPSRRGGRNASRVSSRIDGRGTTTTTTPRGDVTMAGEAAGATAPPAESAQDLLDTSPGDVREVPNISARQWAVVATMCWFAMTCFFVLGAWEANIPIFAAHAFGASPFAAGNLIALGGACAFPFMLANVVLARRVQDRYILAAGCALGLLGLLVAIAAGHATFGSLFACWFFVALGFNLASSVTLSLLSKQMPHAWNRKISLFIQYSNYVGRLCGAVWGGAGVDVGMTRYLGLQLALLGIGGLMSMTLWKEMKAKTG